MPPRQITVYFAGDDPESALEGLPWDEPEGARQYALDNGHDHVYSVHAHLDVRSIEEVIRP